MIRDPVTVHRLPGSLDLGEGVREAGTREIVRRQARMALLTVGVVCTVLVGLPVVVARLPQAGVWMVLSLAVQPVWVALAVHQLWRAERVERDAGRSR